MADSGSSSVPSDGTDCVSLLLLSLVLSVHALSLLLALRPAPCVTDIACGCDDDAASCGGGGGDAGGGDDAAAVCDDAGGGAGYHHAAGCGDGGGDAVGGSIKTSAI